MTSTRWFLLVVGLLAALAFLALWSVEGDPRLYSEDELLNDFEPPDWSRSGLRLLGALGPRLELEQPRLKVAAGSQSKPILVASSDSPFRRAAWVLRAGSRAIVRYEARKSDFPRLREQDLDLTRADREPKSLAILASGGTIRIECRGNQDCVVELVD